MACNALKCPIALALKRNKYKHVLVSDTEVFIDLDKYSLDKEGREFIEDFDDGEKVVPCTIELTKKN